MYIIFFIKKTLVLFICVFLLVGCSGVEKKVEHTKKHSIPYQVATYGGFERIFSKDGLETESGYPWLIGQKSSYITTTGFVAQDLYRHNFSDLSIGMGILMFLASGDCSICKENQIIFFIDAEKFPTEKHAIEETKQQYLEAYKLLLINYSFKYPRMEVPIFTDNFQRYYRRVNTGDDISSYKNYCYQDEGECNENLDFLLFRHMWGETPDTVWMKEKGKHHIKFIDGKSMWAIKIIPSIYGIAGLKRAKDQLNGGFEPMEIYLEFAKILPDNAYLFLSPYMSGRSVPLMFNKGSIMSWTNTQDRH